MTVKTISNDKCNAPRGNPQRCCRERPGDLRPGQHLERIPNLRESAPRAPSVLRGEGLDRVC